MMEYNWPLFDGAHVLVRPANMSVQRLQDGYFHFLREAYSLTGIMRRFRGTWRQPGWAASHMTRNYLLSRYGMSKTAHALSNKQGPIWIEDPASQIASARPKPKKAKPALCPD